MAICTQVEISERDIEDLTTLQEAFRVMCINSSHSTTFIMAMERYGVAYDLLLLRGYSEAYLNKVAMSKVLTLKQTQEVGR